MNKSLIYIMFLALAVILSSCKRGADNSYTNGYFRSDKPLVLTISWMENGVLINPDETPTLQRAKELTNIGLKNVLSKSVTDWKQALNLLITSNKAPDIMHMYERSTILKYASTGAIRPLDDLIDKYAPNIKKYFDEHEEEKNQIKATDGKIYYIPCIADGEVSYGWFIRTDWLNKLNLKMPSNVDEYYNVLKAFKTSDPNGNGKQDEIPYFNRNAGLNYDQSVTCLYVLWNSSTSIMEKDGRMVFGPYEPEFKTAVKNIAKWYKEGIIDPEIFTRGNNARESLLGSNVGGSTYDWFGSTAQFNSVLKDTIPGFEFTPMPPPSGRVYDRRMPIKDVGWTISSRTENVITAIRYMDFWFSKEGRILANYGIEGVTYDMVDGRPVLKESIKNQNKSVVTILNEYGAQLNMGYKQDFEYEKQWLSPIALQGIDMYKKGNYIKPPVPGLVLTAEQRKRINELGPTLNNYVSDIQQQWVLGTKDIEATYDEFIETLKKMHVEEYVAIHQEAYESYKSQKLGH